MNVSLNANLWGYKAASGNMPAAVLIAERRKDASGNYSDINRFWANVRGDAADYIASIAGQIPKQGEHKAPPQVYLEGQERSRGLKGKNGTYEAGFITFFTAGEPRYGTNSGSASTPAAAPAPASDTPDTWEAANAAAAAGGGFMDVPDDEVPFV